MANRNLNAQELASANGLLGEIRAKLAILSDGDPLLLFAYRRKISKGLQYDERGKPMYRRLLKARKWGLQDRKCAHCGLELELSYSELDRFKAADGYTVQNTDLLHSKCHQFRQAEKRFT